MNKNSRWIHGWEREKKKRGKDAKRERGKR